jgi:Do/DeqQ family serine protease
MALVAICAFVAGAMFAAGNAFVQDMVVEPGIESRQAGAAGMDLGQLESVADIVGQVGPAVVKIDTVVASTRDMEWSPLWNDPFFREFFGRPPGMTPQPRQGMGSGFLFSKDGYVLTNEHVIHGATEVWVTLTGHEERLPAKVVGSDYDLDLAVLKVEAPKALPFLKIGDSEKARVGEWVIAIGNPYGLDHTVTLGVISAKSRPVTIEDRYYDNLLQTDASINPGNSGGPLLNLKGEVIGINTAVNAQAQGIGFAIPSTVVKPVLDELVETGKITHPWLGVRLQMLTPDLASYLGLKQMDGVLIHSVEVNSPAARAGVKPGDVLLQLGDEKTKNSQNVIHVVRQNKVGDELEATLYRNGTTITLKVVLGEKPRG